MLEGEGGGRGGLLELGGGGGGDELVGAATDVGVAIVAGGASEVVSWTALSAVGRRRVIMVASAAVCRIVVGRRVDVAGSAVLPTRGSQALLPIG